MEDQHLVVFIMLDIKSTNVVKQVRVGNGEEEKVKLQDKKTIKLQDKKTQ